MTPSHPSGAAAELAACTVYAVRFEHHRVAFGIGERAPRVSWKVRTDRPDWMQRSYELRIDGPDGAWTSGPIGSPDSVLVPWPAAPLRSRDRRSVAVRVSGSDGGTSEWSEPAPVEVGLLESTDWTARLIGIDEDLDPDLDRRPVLFRTEFTVGSQLASARLYLSAHGVVDAEINGVAVDDDVLTPGWTSYRHRLRYRTYDITDLLAVGANAIGATVADGWFRGLIGFEGGQRNIYGDRTGLLAQIELRYADGRAESIGTDSQWRSGYGPIVASGIYPGETYDARLELPGWGSPGFDDSRWPGSRTETTGTAERVAPTGPAVRRIEQVAPTAITRSPSGRWLVDFGQNLVGRLRIRLSGPAGRVVTLRHAEVLENGELATRPLRGAAATDRYTLRGIGIETWEPRFTFHGFRYAEIDGWPGEPRAEDIRAVVLHTDMERTGWFSCSDPLLDRLHENVVWSMRGNFVDLPTDCPQRDERLGWTGDIQVFGPTARFLYDCSGMLASWLADVAAEQRELGTVPVYVPWIPLTWPATPMAAWGDAAVILPFTLYRRDGDLEWLRRQYPSMQAWVDQVTVAAGADHLWNTGRQLGDWLDPSAPVERPEAGRTDPYLVATAYHAFTTGLLAAAAAALDLDEDARRYSVSAADVTAAFRKRYVAGGRLTEDSPTALALALRFGLLDPADREGAGHRLVQLVEADRHHIGTGFVGTPIICDALCAAGAHDTAYRLLTQRGCPSWLYPVTMGATTIWERWDSLLPDGTVNPGDMTSFNHYALGAVADWLHRTVAGLAPAEPGYRRILVSPRPGGGLTSASAAHETPYGRAEVGWTRAADRLAVTVLVPPGTTAVVRLPAPEWAEVTVGSGRHAFACRFRPASDDPVASDDNGANGTDR